VSGRLVAGRYRLGEVIGRGGMGIVWRARDELLNRDVAVKELIWPAGFTEQERQIARRRATREAQTAAQLSQQNIIRIYDIVEEEDGDPWIVMELLPFRSLRDIAREDGPLTPDRAARVGLGVLDGLRAAHAVGIVHRDVKPANILIGPDDRAVLTDFGIARAADSATLTNAGDLVGSPAYTAPERARGERAGAAGDLWGLGASLYAAVEGRPPFHRDHALATLTAVVADEPDPAVHAGPLWPVISALLSKDPDARPGPAEVERMLRDVASGTATRVLAEPAPLVEPAPAPPVEPAPPGPPASRVPRRPLRSRRRLAASAALAVLAAAAVAVALLLASLSSPGRPTAGSPAAGSRSAGASPSASPGGSRSAAPSRGTAPGRGTASAGTGTGHSGTGSSRTGSSGTGPAGTSQPASAPASQPAAGSGSGGAGYGAMPAGFYRFTNSTGFSIGVPNGWQIKHVGHYVYVDDPSNGNIFLLIDQSDQPKPNALADWQQQAANRAGSYPGYHLIRLQSVSYPQAEQAADWEFTYDRGGVTVHILNRNILANAHHAYALYWSVPEAQWSAYYRYFQAFAATFRPAA
jgi:serine/threonine protein kinase